MSIEQLNVVLRRFQAVTSMWTLETPNPIVDA